MSALFAGVGRETIWSRCAELWWHQHGGSGYSISRECVLSMDWDEIEWHLREVQRRRRAEADALKRASRAGS